MTGEVKRCRKCGEEKPGSAEFFPPNSNYKGGLSSMCRPCSSAYYAAANSPEAKAAAAAKRKQKAELLAMGERICTKCKETKAATLDEFYADHRKSSGLTSICKRCHIAATGAHHKTPEAKERRRVLDATDARKSKKRDREAKRKDTPEKIELARTKDAEKAHRLRMLQPEKYKGHGVAYRARHQEKVREMDRSRKQRYTDHPEITRSRITMQAS